MIIILIRHAAAEDISTEKEDRFRNLTSSGRNEFQVTAEGLSLLFPGYSYIMSSPYKRAQQTADILAQCLGNKKIELCDELASPDLNSFIQSCKSKIGTIFAVGHEPFLSKWLFKLTGKKQHFKKGSIAVVEINNTDQGKFILYSEPDSFLRLKNRDFPFKQFGDMLKLRIQMLQGNHSEDIVHDFRVCMRQIKIILYNVKPLIPQENLIKTINEINRLFKYTDKVRDYDVLMNFIHDSGNSLAELIALINNLKEEKLSELLKVIQDESTTLAFLNLFMLLMSLDIKSYKPTVKTRFYSLVRKTSKIAEKVDIYDEPALHRLRINCKKIYYSAGIFPYTKKVYGKKAVELAKSLKDTLGLNHDSYISRLLLEDYMNSEIHEIQEQSKLMLAKLKEKQIGKDEIERLLDEFKASL